MGDTGALETKIDKNEIPEKDIDTKLNKILDQSQTKHDEEHKEKPQELQVLSPETTPRVIETSSMKLATPRNDVEKGETETGKTQNGDSGSKADRDDTSPRSESIGAKNDVNQRAASEEEDNKTETILSPQSLKLSSPSITTANDNTTPAVSTSLKNVKDKHLIRNQSDILPSLREIPRDEDPSMMIFSHKGLPTKKYFRRREINSTILPFGFNEKDASTPREPPSPRNKNRAELTPKISQTVPKIAKPEDQREKNPPLTDKNPNIPTNSNPSISRNVLTGRGVNSQDEFKCRTMRRKDGNPVLGVGYDEPVVSNNTGRVPPGGFSSGLW